MTFFDFRSAPKSVEKTLIAFINAFQLLLDRLARQRLPMRMCRSFQLGCVKTHRLVGGIRVSVFIPLTLPLMEVFMHLPHIVKQVAEASRIRLSAKLILIGFHCPSHITRLSATKWEGRHIVKRQCFVRLPSVILLSIPYFLGTVKSFLQHNRFSGLISHN